MESFSESRIETDLFAHDVSPYPEIDIAISKEQAPKTASSTGKVPAIQNLNRKLRKRAKKSKCKNGCLKEESKFVQSLEHERSKNRQKRLKRSSERHWDVMARRSRKLSSRVSKAPTAPKAQKVNKTHSVQKAHSVQKNFKRQKPHAKRHQKRTSANAEPLGRGSNPWTRWTTPSPGQ